MPGPLLAVDAPFVLYRSFFALPDSILGADERPVNALLGAANVLLRIAADRGPRAIVVCFGAEAAAYRVELSQLSRDRPPLPEALAWQFEQAPEFLQAFGWSTQGSPDLEADDLLGSLASAEEGAGGETLILTGDRDMYQCVGERVRVLYLKSGISGFEEVDPAEVKRRYGVGPALVPDFIALRGDPSDGLPGAPGIGPKTAAELLGRHGSLDGAIAHADGERPRVRAALTEQADLLRSFARSRRCAASSWPSARPSDRSRGWGPGCPRSGHESARRAPRGRRVGERPLASGDAAGDVLPTPHDSAPGGRRARVAGGAVALAAIVTAAAVSGCGSSGGSDATAGHADPAASPLRPPAAISLDNGWRFYADARNLGMREDWSAGPRQSAGATPATGTGSGATPVTRMRSGGTPVTIPNDFNPTWSGPPTPAGWAGTSCASPAPRR